MTTLEITIPIASAWPTAEELAGRRAVEDALNAKEIGILEGAGAGRGRMDLAYRVENELLAVAHEAIREVMATVLPGSRYNIREIAR